MSFSPETGALAPPKTPRVKAKLEVHPKKGFDGTAI